MMPSLLYHGASEQDDQAHCVVFTWNVQLPFQISQGVVQTPLTCDLQATCVTRQP